MASIGGYRSPVDIGLGQVPITTDPEIFPEMTSVYNAIHLLNQYLDQLRLVAEGGGGSGQSPADSMPFNRFYVAPALVNIAVGQIICPSSVPGQNGMLLGCLANNYTSTAPSANFTGVALTSALAGEDVRVGIGPAVIAQAGAVSGQLIWAYSSLTIAGTIAGNGNIYLGNPGAYNPGTGVVYPMPVATCPRDGFILFGQYISR